MLSVVGSWPEGVPLRVACDVRNPLLGPRGAASRLRSPERSGPAEVVELERRLGAIERLAPFRTVAGAGAGGGLGAALAALGGELCEGAELVLDAIGFDERAAGADFAVTGEGTVDADDARGEGAWSGRAALRADSGYAACSSAAGSRAERCRPVR